MAAAKTREPTYRRLGRSGLLVSPLCLGAMMFGLRTDQRAAAKIVDAARAAGVNFIDTADQYAYGKSEEIVGRCVKRDRDRWVIATKVATVWEKAPNRSGLSRKWILEQLDASLKRLGTDYVDLYYFHRDEHETPIEESLLAVDAAIRAGKVRYLALSNYRGYRIAEMSLACDRLGMARPVALQPYYNAMNRMPEVEELPAAARFGLGVVPYSPLARGVLTGKYEWGKKPSKETRVGRDDPRILATEWRKESVEIAQVIKRHAEKRGMTAGEFAVNWVLNNALVSSVICGPRTIEQWRSYLSALDHSFTAEDEALVNKLVKPGHPSTPGYNDPNYPPAGRPTRTR
ncbi:MAG: aldo/keto reductase [Alphaproteobacteria bacterium]|nr:aldo/keto reductase [Alphaproteobacteria bacterium]